MRCHATRTRSRLIVRTALHSPPVHSISTGRILPPDPGLRGATRAARTKRRRARCTPQARVMALGTRARRSRAGERCRCGPLLPLATWHWQASQQQQEARARPAGLQPGRSRGADGPARPTDGQPNQPTVWARGDASRAAHSRSLGGAAHRRRGARDPPGDLTCGLPQDRAPTAPA